jgi:hypothetical protein
MPDDYPPPVSPGNTNADGTQPPPKPSGLGSLVGDLSRLVSSAVDTVKARSAEIAEQGRAVLQQGGKILSEKSGDIANVIGGIPGVGSVAGR